jgi:hypothetical protein
VLDQVVTDIIGNSKIPSIDFGTYPDPTVALAEQTAAANAPGAVPVTIPVTTNEDGTLRFAPGQPKG